MLISEFQNRTGIYPSENLYSVIEKFYGESKEDKDEFCRRYMMNADCLAEKIQRECNQLELKKEQEFFSRIGELEAKLEITGLELSREKNVADMLRLQLDQELEWQLSEHAGTNMKQTDYAELAKQYDSCLNDNEALNVVSEMFGFIPELIIIRHHAEIFEVNKYHRLRVKETCQREPRYISSDWNYIRFDCAGCQWELVNGSLLPYED